MVKLFLHVQRHLPTLGRLGALEWRKGREGQCITRAKATHLVVLHGEGTAGAGTDAGLALDALVSLGGVEESLAVNEGKKAVGASIDASATASAVVRSLRISRHDDLTFNKKYEL